MKKEKADFVKKAQKQLNIMFGIENGDLPDCRELEMLVYMHMISYHFDDREPVDKTYSELHQIAQKCVRKTTDNNLTIGKVLRCKPEDGMRLNNLARDTTEEGETKWKIEYAKFVLEKTRNSICHGAFEINDNNIVEIDNTNESNPFKINYEFDCLIDVCKELADKEQLNYYENVLKCIHEHSKMDFSNQQNKLIYFDLAISLLVGYNESEVYDPNNNVSGFINSLYNLNTDLSSIKHIRNSVTHHYRTLDVNNDNMIRIFDYRDKNRNQLSADFLVDFNKFVNFMKQISIDDIIPEGDNRDSSAYPSPD